MTDIDEAKATCADRFGGVGVFARRRIAEIEAALAIVEQRLPSAGA